MWYWVGFKVLILGKCFIRWLNDVRLFELFLLFFVNFIFCFRNYWLRLNGVFFIVLDCLSVLVIIVVCLNYVSGCNVGYIDVKVYVESL